MATLSKKPLLPWFLLSIAVVVAILVGFYSQAAALSYASLLRAVLLYGVLPQAVMVAGLWALGSRMQVVVGSAATLASWLLVAELAVRVNAA